MEPLDFSKLIENTKIMIKRKSTSCAGITCSNCFFYYYDYHSLIGIYPARVKRCHVGSIQASRCAKTLKEFIVDVQKNPDKYLDLMI